MSTTLFLRLSGPMQSWGTGSRLQIRRTDLYPSKSGVLGLILCGMGVDRDSASVALEPLVALQMAVRIDRPGHLDWDYHTAGAGIGLRKAEGGVKRTATTKEIETLLSRRQYLLDASFLVALQGPSAVIQSAADALRDPVWPVFLGRKCCVPSEPVFVDTGEYQSLQHALEAIPLSVDSRFDDGGSVELEAVMEHPAGSPPPEDARLVYDVPRTLRHPSHGPRWVFLQRVRVQKVVNPSTSTRQPGRRWVNYSSDQWKAIRQERLKYDNLLCVFCKSPAEEVHHVTYANAGREQLDDLRSLCRICHDACTQLEYGRDMRERRVDPCDPRQRDLILRQITLLLTSRRLGRRRQILENTRSAAPDFLSDASG